MADEAPKTCPNCSVGGRHTPLRRYPGETYWVCPDCGAKTAPVEEPEPPVEGKGVPNIASAIRFRAIALLALILYGLILLGTAESGGTGLPWWFWLPSIVMFIFFMAILGALDAVIDAVAELEVYTGYQDTVIDPDFAPPLREEKPKTPDSPCAKCGKETLSPPYCEECWAEETGGPR